MHVYFDLKKQLKSAKQKANKKTKKPCFIARPTPKKLRFTNFSKPPPTPTIRDPRVLLQL